MVNMSPGTCIFLRASIILKLVYDQRLFYYFIILFIFYMDIIS